MRNQIDNTALYNSITALSPSECQAPALIRATSALIFGVLTSIPYYKTAEGFANNKTMEEIFGISNVIALTFFNSWFFHRLFLILQRKKITFDQTLCATIIKMLPVAFLAMISATPDTYTTYQYNKDQEYLAVISFFSDTLSGLFLFSELHTQINAVYQHGFSHRRNTAKMIKVLEQGLQSLIAEQDDLSAYILRLRDSVSTQAVLGELAQIGMRKLSENALKPLPFDYSSYAHAIVACLFAASWKMPWLFTLNKLTRSGLNSYGINATLALIISCFSIIPDCVLAVIVAYELYDRVLNGINQICDRIFCQNYESRFYPVLYYSVKFFTWCFMALSFGTVGTMVQSAFGDNAPLLRYVLGTLIFERLYISSDLLNQSFRSIPLVSNANQIGHMLLLHAVKTTSGFLSECTPEQLSQFMADVGCDQQTFNATPNPYSLFLCCDNNQTEVESEEETIAVNNASI